MTETLEIPMTLWIGYARSGREFDVQAALAEIGVKAWVAKKIVAKRSGKRRYADAVTVPYLPNYVFIEATADQWHKLSCIKHLSPTTTAISSRDTGLDAFKARLDAAYEEDAARVAAGEAVSEFSDGDSLDVIGGPLSGVLVEFRRVVEADPFPMIEGEAEVMGRTATVKLDILDVKRAG